MEGEIGHDREAVRCKHLAQRIIALGKTGQLGAVAVKLDVITERRIIAGQLADLCRLGGITDQNILQNGYPNRIAFLVLLLTGLRREEVEMRLAVRFRNVLAAHHFLVDRDGVLVMLRIRDGDRIVAAVIAGVRAGTCLIGIQLGAVAAGAVSLLDHAVLDHKCDRRFQHIIGLAVRCREGRALVGSFLQRVGAVRQSGDDRILVGRIPCDAVCRISRIALGVLYGQLVIALAVLCIQHGACFVRLHKRQNQLRAFQRIVICDVLLGD